jgi:predicted PurR-regulated permease PerM
METRLIITTIIIVLVVVFAAWYLYSVFSDQNQQDYGSQPVSDTTADTTSRISSDLNQIPDESSLNSDIDSLNQSVQGF